MAWGCKTWKKLWNQLINKAHLQSVGNVLHLNVGALSLRCRRLVLCHKVLFSWAWPPLQDHYWAKQEMTLLPSFLFRQGTGMSLGNPPPLPSGPSSSLSSSSSSDKRLSFPVLDTPRRRLTVMFWTGKGKLGIHDGHWIIILVDIWVSTP